MTDPASIAATTGAVVAAGRGALAMFTDFTRLVKKDPDAAAAKALEMREALIDLIDKTIDLKVQHSALLDRNEELVKLNTQLTDFDSLRKNLRPTRLSNGTIVCQATEPVQGIPEGVSLCVKCYEEGRKGLLQFRTRDFHFDLYRCTLCSQTVKIPNDHSPAILTGGRRIDDDGFL